MINAHFLKCSRPVPPPSFESPRGCGGGRYWRAWSANQTDDRPLLSPLPKLESTTSVTGLEAGKRGFTPGLGIPLNPEGSFKSESGWGAPGDWMRQKAAFYPHPGLAIWIPIQQLLNEAASSLPLLPPNPAPPAWLTSPVHRSAYQATQPFSASLASSAHNPPAPNQRELRNSILAQEQLLSKRFLIICMERELGTALAHDGAKLAKPALTPLHCPPTPGALAIQNFQNVPSLSFSLLRDVKPGTTKKGGKARALSLLRTQPLPPAPTRPALCKRTFSPHHSPSAARRPRGLAQLGARGQGDTRRPRSPGPRRGQGRERQLQRSCTA